MGDDTTLVTPEQALALASTLLQGGHCEQAASILEQIAAQGYESAHRLLLLARIARLQSRLDEAARLFHAASDADPALDEAHAGLIGVLEAQGKYDQAAVALRRARIDRNSQRARADALLKESITSPAPIIIDAGAHLGESCDRFLTLVPRACLHAFEPVPVLAQGLRTKFAANPQIRVVSKGLSDAEGELIFHANQDDATGSFLPLDAASPYAAQAGNSPAQSCTVPTTTLDAYCAQQTIARIDLLKLDVQGHEAACLAGAQNLLRQGAIGAIQVEIITAPFYAKPGSFLDIERHLIPLGWRLATLFDVFPDLGDPLFQLDAIYLPPGNTGQDAQED